MLKKTLLIPVLALALAGTASAQGNSANATSGNATSSAKTETKGNATSTAASAKPKEDNGQGAENRSEVAKFVQNLLQVADRNGNMGAEVRKVANEQASSTKAVEDAKVKVEKKSKALTMLFGPDYKNLGAIRSELAKGSARLEQLKRELERMPWESATLTPAIKTLEDEQAKIEAFIKANEDKFSIFGWAFKLFQ